MPTVLFRPSLLAGLLCLLFVPAGFAQTDTTGTVLPDIAPREVEIRGTLEISFPSLQRQPLVGFNPPPRVPNIPADRRPFVESYRDASPMPQTSDLRRPEPPAALTGALFPPAGGLIEAGGGRYFSRFAHAHVGTPLSPKTALLARLDYDGSDGHEPFDEAPDVRAPFDAVEGQLTVQSITERWSITGGIEGFYTAYDLYGAGGVDANAESLLSRPERQGSGGAGRLRFATIGAPIDAALGFRFGGTEYQTTLLPDSSDASTLKISERRLELDGSLTAPFSQGDLWVDAELSTGGLSGDLGSTTSIDAGAGLRFLLGRTLRLTVGGRFLAALSDTDQPRETSEKIEIGYASPEIRLEWLPARNLRLYAHHRPGMAANALADVFRTNPYLVPQPGLRPTLRSVDAEAGINVFAGPVQLGARGGYREYPQFMFFEDGSSDPYVDGFSTLHYADADVYHVGGSVSATLPGGFYALLDVTYRDGRLPEADDLDIPYFAPVVGEATLSYAFEGQRGLVQVTGYFESSRYVDRAQSRELGGFLDLDVEASYQITPALGILGRIENIGGSDNARWERYPISPMVVGAGLRVRW